MTKNNRKYKPDPDLNMNTRRKKKQLKGSSVFVWAFLRIQQECKNRRETEEL